MVILLDKKLTRPLQSRAIGITPPSLEIFRKLKLDDSLIKVGVPVPTLKAILLSRSWVK